jgi:hypothetical protein
MGSTHFKYQFFKSQQILSMNVELKQKALPEESAFCLRRVSSLWDSNGTNNDFRTQKKALREKGPFVQSCRIRS